MKKKRDKIEVEFINKNNLAESIRITLNKQLGVEHIKERLRESGIDVAEVFDAYPSDVSQGMRASQRKILRPGVWPIQDTEGKGITDMFTHWKNGRKVMFFTKING